MGFFVYIHTAPNKKRYVGITAMNPKQRWKGGCGYRSNHHFYAAIKKYGWKNFTHQVFEVSSEEAMYCNEQELIELFMTNNPKYGYNKSAGGEKSSFGCSRSLSQETKLKISISNIGKHGKGMGRERQTEETKNKIRDAQKGHAKPQYKWLTPVGEIVGMSIQNAKRFHPDWVKIND